MTSKSISKILGMALLVLLVAVMSGCAFRDATCDVEQGKPVITEGQDRPVGSQADVSDLERRVSDLEKKTAENAALAEHAQQTADKALKCCRKDYTVVMTEEIYFDFNKFDIKASEIPALDRVAERLKADPDLICECKGNTDGVGGTDYNIVLGQKRADAARMYLIDKHNIAMGRIAIRTFGKDAPIASNDDESGRAKNRRVTIDVLGFAE
jgi:outer membrane protein OmpA-like peptidoglycan-associated protein